MKKRNYMKEFLKANGMLAKFEEWKAGQIAEAKASQVKFYTLDFELDTMVVKYKTADEYPSGEKLYWTGEQWTMTKTAKDKFDSVKTVKGDCYSIQELLYKYNFLPAIKDGKKSYKEFRRKQ